MKEIEDRPELEKKLREYLEEKRIRLKEFFLDFDPLRKGVITEDKVSKGKRKV